MLKDPPKNPVVLLPGNCQSHVLLELYVTLSSITPLYFLTVFSPWEGNSAIWTFIFYWILTDSGQVSVGWLDIIYIIKTFVKKLDKI